MEMIFAIALLCVLAGLAMIVLGFILTWKEMQLRNKVQQAVEANSNVISQLATTTAKTGKEGLGSTSQQQAAIVGANEFTKSLAELAKNLSGLTPAIASFIIATILFFFAASLAAIDYIAK